MSKTKLLFAGGHHNSALPVIDELIKDGNYNIYWIGKKYTSDKRTLTPEYIDISKRGIEFYNLIAGKLFRTTTIRYFHLVLLNLLKIPVGLVSSIYYLLRSKPDIIISFGGYIALPIVFVGKIFGKKVLTHEQTLVIGLSNQIISTFSNKILTAWPIESYEVSNKIKEKMVYVGLPINERIFTEKSKIDFKDKEKPVIYVAGGKLGSDYINNLILSNIDYLSENYNIIWSTGAGKSINKNFENYKNIYVKEYFNEDELYKIYNSLNLAITRAGAHTVYELLVKNKKAILIPIPWSSKNEQYKNAEVMRGYGLGEVFDQEKGTNEEFIQSIKEILQNNGNPTKKFSTVINPTQSFINEIKNL